ncbi:hypothetical protein Q2T40_04250 [Winogradskyella maritima]|nr:hypothetical protein [Winogradskyella maritima]
MHIQTTLPKTPDTLQTVFEYDGFSILWEHATGIDGGNYGRNHGIAFIGNNGTLVVDRNGLGGHFRRKSFQGWGKKGIPKMEAIKKDKGDKSGLDLHTANFIDAVKSRDASQLNAPIKLVYDAALVSHYGVTWPINLGIEFIGMMPKQALNKRRPINFLKANYQNGWKLPML